MWSPFPGSRESHLSRLSGSHISQLSQTTKILQASSYISPLRSDYDTRTTRRQWSRPDRPGSDAGSISLKQDSPGFNPGRESTTLEGRPSSRLTLERATDDHFPLQQKHRRAG